MKVTKIENKIRNNFEELKENGITDICTTEIGDDLLIPDLDNKLITNPLFAQAMMNFPVVDKVRSKYDPDRMIPALLKLAREGRSMNYVAATFGVAKSTLVNWAKRHKEWKEAMSMANDISEAVWEEVGTIAMTDKEAVLDPKLYEMQANHRFKWKKEARETTQVDVVIKNDTGGGQDAVDIKNMDVNKLLEMKALLERSVNESVIDVEVDDE